MFGLSKAEAYFLPPMAMPTYWMPQGIRPTSEKRETNLPQSLQAFIHGHAHQVPGLCRGLGVQWWRNATRCPSPARSQHRRDNKYPIIQMYAYWDKCKDRTRDQRKVIGNGMEGLVSGKLPVDPWAEPGRRGRH